MQPAAQKGFTFVELLVIMAVMGILMQFGSVSLIRFQQYASTNSSISSLVRDIRQQQLRAMSGDTAGTGTRNDFGIHFLPDRYIAFFGASYSPTNPTNFVIVLEPNIRIAATTLPGGTLIFRRGSGEIATGNAEETISIRNTANNELRIIRINRLGVITAID